MKTQRLINPNDRMVTALQSRHHTSLELILDYAEQMSDGVQFDPCSAIETPDGNIFIWDGKHRLESAIRNGSMLLVDLEPGTKEEAIWKACSANKKHGLKRSNADIQKAVQDALQLHPEKSDRDIGLWVGCDHKTVGKYRKELASSGEIPQMPTRAVKRGDQEYQMDMPIKIEPIEKPDVNQTVRHFTGFIPADLQASTQKSLSFHKTISVKTVPGTDRKIVTRKCVDCGKEFEKPEDRPDLVRCHDCAMNNYEKITITTPTEKISILAPRLEPEDHRGTEEATKIKEEFDRNHHPEPEPDFEPRNAAQQILDTLEQNQSWVNSIVKRFADSKYFPYETTDMKLFREVTIRKPTGETNRFGEERLKRYRLDGVAVIKINDHRYKPILVGFEVKVDKHDLLNDKKMHEYLDYVDMFFVVIPRTLGVAYIDYHMNHPYKVQIGNIIVEHDHVDAPALAEILHPGERERQDIMTELLMKSLWKEKRQVHLQTQGEETLQMLVSDRDKLIKSGLRLLSCTKTYRDKGKYRIKEYSFTNGLVNGTWKKLEDFDTLNAIKTRIKELEQKPNVIFDGRI